MNEVRKPDGWSHEKWATVPRWLQAHLVAVEADREFWRAMAQDGKRLDPNYPLVPTAHQLLRRLEDGELVDSVVELDAVVPVSFSDGRGGRFEVRVTGAGLVVRANGATAVVVKPLTETSVVLNSEL